MNAFRRDEISELNYARLWPDGQENLMTSFSRKRPFTSNATAQRTARIGETPVDNNFHIIRGMENAGTQPRRK